MKKFGKLKKTCYFALFLILFWVSGCKTSKKITMCDAELRERLSKLEIQITKLTKPGTPAQPGGRIEVTNNGALGDVKYSILSPTAFKQVNGFGWTLLDSTYDYTSSDLYKNFVKDGLPAKLPDGRGMFIRGMMNNDSKQSKENGDPFGRRTVGGFQGDTLRYHEHTIDDIQIHDAGGVPGKGEPYWMVKGFLNKTRTTRGFGGSETRPKNIALYIYIKLFSEKVEQL